MAEHGIDFNNAATEELNRPTQLLDSTNVLRY
jgi:hypothetical protein